MPLHEARRYAEAGQTTLEELGAVGVAEARRWARETDRHYGYRPLPA